MRSTIHFCVKSFVLLAVAIHTADPTCVWESDFGFKLNCAFKKAGLFRVRNLGGLKAHASLGFSLGDELGFEQSLTNQDPSRRRSVSIKSGAPPNLLANTSVRPNVRQEKRSKQNRIMLRPQPTNSRPNPAAMESLTSLHRRVSSTMQPIVVSPTIEAPIAKTNAPKVTMAKPLPMGVPPFKPLPPKDESLKVVPLPTSTKKTFTPLQIPQSKGPGLVYQSETRYPQISHDQVSKMVSQMTATHMSQYPQRAIFRITPEPLENYTPKIFTSQIPIFHSIPTTLNPFLPMPVASPPAEAAISIIPAPVLKDSIQIPLAPSMLSKTPTAYSLAQNTMSIQKIPTSNTPNLSYNFVDPVPKHVNDLANQLYPVYNTKKVDDYNTITGYGDDTVLKINKDEINEKISEIAKAGNISMEAVEAAIALRQQQLLNKYANIPMPTTTTTTTTTTELSSAIDPEPEPDFASVVPKQKRYPTAPVAGKVMNAPKEYYPVGYEKNFDDHFQSKVDLPDTSFHCGDQKYFPGLYGDETLGCMVFHVCALTDDGLVMKSFLCPESTLFDQTILKCNWWFYVDCKNTRKLYETNIPVSKSYQLMKALTFFSNYKKENQDDGGRATNPEDMAGIKEAITILENQDYVKSEKISIPEYINSQLTDNSESNIYKINDYNNNTTNNQRANRNSRIQSRVPDKPVSNDTLTSSSEIITVTAKTVNTRTPTENSSRERKKSSRFRNTNRQTQRHRTTTRAPVSSTEESTSTTSTTTSSTTTTTIDTIIDNQQPIAIETELKPEIILSTAETVKEEKLADPEESHERILADIHKEANKSPEVKRFYRSSAEKGTSEEMAIVNNEKVQIIRPKPYSRLVGQFPTPTAAIQKLDEAILGKSFSSKNGPKVTIITPQHTKDSIEHKSPT